jgi:secondary thiamine-phosphate synthase enzyme
MTLFADSHSPGTPVHSKPASLHQYQEEIAVVTTGPGLLDITVQIHAALRRSSIYVGIATLFLQHTSCSLVVQENADSAVRADLQRWLARLAPRSSDWTHVEEGDDDMPSHLRAAITGASLSLPLRRGALALGRWQAIYLWEHRDAMRERNLIVHVLGTLRSNAS